MWLTQSSQSGSVSSKSPLGTAQTAIPLALSCLSPAQVRCLADALSSPWNVLPPSLYSSKSSLCQSAEALACKQKSHICLSRAQREKFPGALTMRGGREAGRGQWDGSQGGLQKGWDHTSGTIWSAHLHPSCNLPDRQVGPVWGHWFRGQSLFAEPLAGLLAARSQCEIADSPWALAEESYSEKQHLALAFQPKRVLEEEAHQGKFRALVRRDWMSESPSTFSGAHRAHSTELSAKPLPHQARLP